MFPTYVMRMTPNQRVMIGNFKHDSGLFGTLLSRIDVLAAVHIPNMYKKVEMFTQNDCKELNLRFKKTFHIKFSPLVPGSPLVRWGGPRRSQSNPPEGVTIGPCWTSALLRRICAKPGPKNLRELGFREVGSCQQALDRLKKTCKRDEVFNV